MNGMASVAATAAAVEPTPILSKKSNELVEEPHNFTVSDGDAQMMDVEPSAVDKENEGQLPGEQMQLPGNPKVMIHPLT